LTKLFIDVLHRGVDKSGHEFSLAGCKSSK
jgi:hypothetical protein